MEDQPTVDKSLKVQAEEIMAAINRDLQRAETTAPAAVTAADSQVNALMRTIFGVVSNVDIEAAAERVKALRAEYPETPPPELAQKLIRDKCQRTGAVGAVTSGAGLIPGLGTAAALTLGVAADIGATFKLQAELVLEIAAVYDYPLTEREKQQVVLLITGLSAGTSALARRAGQTAAVKIGEVFAEKAILKALPVVGVVASAGTNVLSTYVIGQRADAYFRLGPQALGSWSDSLRTISGVDERRIGKWLVESSRATGSSLALGAGKVGEVGRAAGELVVTNAGRVANTAGPAISSGAKKAGAVAQTGVRAYLRWLVTFWTAVFHVAGRIFYYIWAVISFIPRKIIGLFQGKGETKQVQ